MAQEAGQSQSSKSNEPYYRERKVMIVNIRQDQRKLRDMMRASKKQGGKKVQCADPHCDGVIAHQISDKTFELKRLDQGVTMTGSHWSSMATCPKNPKHQTLIVVTDGKVDASLLRRHREEVGDQDDDKGGAEGSSGQSA